MRPKELFVQPSETGLCHGADLRRELKIVQSVASTTIVFFVFFWIWEVTKNLKVTLRELQRFRVEARRETTLSKT